MIVKFRMWDSCLSPSRRPTTHSCSEVRIEVLLVHCNSKNWTERGFADLVRCRIFFGFSTLRLLEPIAKRRTTNFDWTRSSNDNVAKSSQHFDTVQRLIISFTMPSGQGHRCKPNLISALPYRWNRRDLSLHSLTMEQFANTICSIRARVCSVHFP